MSPINMTSDTCGNHMRVHSLMCNSDCCSITAMREMALDTLRGVTYVLVCGIQSYRHDFSQKEHTQDNGCCRPKGRLHDHLCRPRSDRQRVGRVKERPRKVPHKYEGYAPFFFTKHLVLLIKLQSCSPCARPQCRMHVLDVSTQRAFGRATRKEPQPP